MKKLVKTYDIGAKASVVWRFLTEPELINKWEGGPAVMDDKVGTNFKLWAGEIHGTNVEVIKRKKLVQDWFSGNWETPSRVEITLDGQGSETFLTLNQTGIPDEEFEEIEEGWDSFYLLPLKEVAENF